MQPIEESETNTFEVNIKSRNPFPESTEQLTVDAFVTCNPEKIAEIHTKLINSGINESYLQSDDWILIFELQCNPGCEKELIDELNKTYDQGERPETVLHKIMRRLRNQQIKIDIFEANTKVFVKLTLGEDHKSRKCFKFFPLIKDLHDMSLYYVMNGEKVTQSSPQFPKDSIKFSGVELNLKSVASKQLGALIQSVLKELEIVSHPLVLLPSLSSAKINITSSSLQKLDDLFKCDWNRFWQINSPNKKILHNEFRFWFGFQKQFIIESTIKIDSPSLFLTQMHKLVWNKIK